MPFETQYADALGKTHEAVTKTTDLWAQGIQKLLSTKLPEQAASFDPSKLIDPLFEGAQNWVHDNPVATRVLEINKSFAKELVEAMVTLQGAVRDYSEAILEVVRDQVGATADVVKEQSANMTQAAQEQAVDAQLLEYEIKDDLESN